MLPLPVEAHSQPVVAIIGARGLVGQEALSILAERRWDTACIRVFGSARSVGQQIGFRDSWLRVEPISDLNNRRVDYALPCADAQTARECVELLDGTPCTIIDNSSAFRMDPSIPLVIPEVNWGSIGPDTSLIANPNCSTIMLLTALNPLRAAFGIRSLQVTTYQAVSGAGRAGLESLRAQTRAHLLGETIPGGVFPVPPVFDVFEHESAIDPESGFNGEESKMIAESRKIWAEPGLGILPTCVRVPVERSHAQAITVELNRTCSVESIRETLRHAPGVVLSQGDSPLTPASIAGTDDVFVGRVRIDPSDARRALLWICCDQIRKGAALNAIQIMTRLIEQNQGRASGSPSGCATSSMDTPSYAASS